jgi:ABC-2 type transport system permease protein
MDLFRLAAIFFRIGAMNEVQYRVNFLVQLFEAAVALATGLIGLSLVFRHTTELAGWSQAELLVVMGVHILMGGLIQSVIQPNMLRLAEDVQEGTLDYILTKPVDAQVLVSVREIRIWQVVNIVLGLLVVGTALFLLGGRIGALEALIFTLALFCGGLLIYSFWLILTTVAFWVVRVENILNLFEGFYAAGRWPVGIYPPWLRGLLTFLVPVAFAVTVPAETLVGRLNPLTLAVAVGLALGFLALARTIWRIGLRNYAGASA